MHIKTDDMLYHKTNLKTFLIRIDTLQSINFDHSIIRQKNQ